MLLFITSRYIGEPIKEVYAQFRVLLGMTSKRGYVVSPEMFKALLEAQEHWIENTKMRPNTYSKSGTHCSLCWLCSGIEPCVWRRTGEQCIIAQSTLRSGCRGTPWSDCSNLSPESTPEAIKDMSSLINNLVRITKVSSTS